MLTEFASSGANYDHHPTESSTNNVQYSAPKSPPSFLSRSPPPQETELIIKPHPDEAVQPLPIESADEFTPPLTTASPLPNSDYSQEHSHDDLLATPSRLSPRILSTLSDWILQRTNGWMSTLIDRGHAQIRSLYRRLYNYHLRVTAQWFIYRHRLQYLIIDTRTRLMITDGQDPEQYRRIQLQNQQYRLFGKHLMPDRTLNQFYSSLRDVSSSVPSMPSSSPTSITSPLTMVPIGMDYGSSGGGVSPTSASNNYSFSFPSVPMAYRLERHHLVDRSLKNYVNECNSDIYNNIRDSSHDHSIR